MKPKLPTKPLMRIRLSSIEELTTRGMFIESQAEKRQKTHIALHLLPSITLANLNNKEIPAALMHISDFCSNLRSFNNKTLIHFSVLAQLKPFVSVFHYVIASFNILWVSQEGHKNVWLSWDVGAVVIGSAGSEEGGIGQQCH